MAPMTSFRTIRGEVKVIGTIPGEVKVIGTILGEVIIQVD